MSSTISRRRPWPPYDKEGLEAMVQPKREALRYRTFHAQLIEASNHGDKAESRKAVLKAVKSAAPDITPKQIKFLSLRRCTDNVLRFRS